MTEDYRSTAWTTATRQLVGALGARGEAFGVADRALVEVAVFHGIEGQLRRSVGPGSTALDAAVHAAQARHLRVNSDLGVVARALGDRVPFLVAKGPALAATCYPAPELRSYVDLDVLVRPDDVRETVRLLRRAGMVLLDANWPVLTAAGVHELRLGGSCGGAIDLHWSLRPRPDPAAGKSEFDRLMEGSAEIKVDRSRVRILGPADAVVHVAVHAAASGGHRLIWLTDLRGAIQHAAEVGELERVPAVTDAWSARPAMAVMLRRLRRTLGFAVPAELAGLVRPAVWAGVVGLTDRISPPELAGAGASASRLVARSASTSDAASLRTVAAKASLWVRGRGSPRLSVAEMLDPTDARSALHRVGGSAAEEAFFARLASGGSARGAT